MIVELLNNGVKYDWCVTGPQGARFTIYLLKGVHTSDDVIAAKKQLKREQDVVKIYTEWKNRDEWEELKLFLHPVAAINNQLNKEYNEQFRD